MFDASSVLVEERPYPPLVLTENFMVRLLSRQVYRRIKFNEKDLLIASLSLAERNYFIYKVFTAVGVSVKALMNIFVSIPTLKVWQIQALQDKFLKINTRYSDRLFNNLSSSFENASGCFKSDFSVLAQGDANQKKLLSKLKLEYGIIQSVDGVRHVSAIKSNLAESRRLKKVKKLSKFTPFQERSHFNASLRLIVNNPSPKERTRHIQKRPWLTSVIAGKQNVESGAATEVLQKNRKQGCESTTVFRKNSF